MKRHRIYIELLLLFLLATNMSAMGHPPILDSTYRADKELLPVDKAGLSKRESQALALKMIRAISKQTPQLFLRAEGRDWDAHIEGYSHASRIFFLTQNLKHGGIPWRHYLHSDSLSMQADIYGRYDPESGEYKRGVSAFESKIPERNKKDDLATFSQLGANIYAESIDFGGRQVFPNPIRKIGEASYTYTLDSIYLSGGEQFCQIGFRSLSGLAKGRVTIKTSRPQVTAFEIHAMMKGIISESYQVELSEIEPDLPLPTRYAIEISHKTWIYHKHNSYWAEISYTGTKLDREKLPIINPADKSFYRLHDSLGYAPIASSRMAFGREDSTTSWKNVIVSKRNNLKQMVPWQKALLWGHQYQIGDRWRVGNEGLIWSLFYYNYADQLWCGQAITATYDMAPGYKWVIRPGLYYVTKRKRAVWTLNSKLFYAPSRRGFLELSAGHRTFDLENARERADQLTDLMMNLLNGQGPTTRYDDKFVRLTNRIDLSPKVNIETSLMLSERNPVKPGETWSLFGSSITEILNISHADPNIPRIVPPHRLLEVQAKVTINPLPFYRYDSKGFLNRIGEGVYAPLIALSYRGGIGMGRKTDAQFHLLDLSIQQRLILSSARSLFYQVNLGGYISRKVIYPSEYFFLKGSNTFWRFGDSMSAAFQTLPPYTATDKKHFILQTSYQASRLFMNFLPVSFLKTNEEAIHFKARWDIISTKPYLEIGYSQNIGTLIQAGIFFGGYNFFYERGVAIRFAFNM